MTATGTGPVAEEAPVDLEFNGEKIATLLCTPRDLQALVLGWLYSQGLIRGLGEVITLGACEDMKTIKVTTSVDRRNQEGGWHQVITSGCGGGGISESHLKNPPPPVQSDLHLGLDDVTDLAKKMLAGAELYRETGGVHGAALAKSGELVAQAEDIGRHNAVDKVIGQGLFRNLPFNSCVLLATGRLSSEMVLKAAQAGIPIVATLSIPTTLAVEVAATAGITLVGRVLRPERFVYGNQSRISR